MACQWNRTPSFKANHERGLILFSHNVSFMLVPHTAGQSCIRGWLASHSNRKFYIWDMSKKPYSILEIWVRVHSHYLDPFTLYMNCSQYGMYCSDWKLRKPLSETLNMNEMGKYSQIINKSIAWWLCVLSGSNCFCIHTHISTSTLSSSHSMMSREIFNTSV